jgi:hypothetical protein
MGIANFFFGKVFKSLLSKKHRKIVSPIIMHVACSSVNCGLKENPSLVKNQQIFLRSLTAKLMKIFEAIIGMI